jgi:hypothetical protein
MEWTGTALSIILLAVTFTQRTYRTNHVSKIYNTTAVLWLQYVVLVVLLSMTHALYFYFSTFRNGARGGAVVEALRCKPEGRGIVSRWWHWNFSLT